MLETMVLSIEFPILILREKKSRGLHSASSCCTPAGSNRLPEGWQEGEGVVESERISADFLSFHNGVGTVDQFRNDKITL